MQLPVGCSRGSHFGKGPSIGRVPTCVMMMIIDLNRQKKPERKREGKLNFFLSLSLSLSLAFLVVVVPFSYFPILLMGLKPIWQCWTYPLPPLLLLHKANGDSCTPQGAEIFRLDFHGTFNQDWLEIFLVNRLSEQRDAFMQISIAPIVYRFISCRLDTFSVWPR